MALNNERFIERLIELKDVYSRVKTIYLLAENIDSDQRLWTGAINELRNSFDHIIRCLEYPDKMEAEFDDALDHVYRAGYDTCELLSMELVTRVQNLIKDYSSEVINRVFPGYFAEIRPKLLEIQIDLSKTRGEKKYPHGTANMPVFLHYEMTISTLLEYLKKCDLSKPDLISETEKENAKAEEKAKEKADEEQKKKNEKFRDRVYGFIIAVVLAIIGLGLKYLYDRNVTPLPQANQAEIRDTLLKNNKVDSTSTKYQDTTKKG